MQEIASLQMALIYRRSGARVVQPKAVTALAESMKIIGLKSPIEVRRCQKIRNGAPADAYEIVSGQHRFEAARQLGWTDIPAFISEETEQRQRLWELDENLLRNEGTAAERARWHSERAALLVEMGLAKAKPGPEKDNAKSATSYADQASKSLGVSRRTVASDLSRGKSIAPEILAEVAGTDLDKGVVLDRLAAVPAPQQARVLADIRQERAVRPASAPLSDADATERQLAGLMAAWNKAGPDARDAFLAGINATQQPRAA